MSRSFIWSLGVCKRPLIEQAAEQFAIWRNVRPDTKEVLAMLRHEQSGNALS
ncbi:MULTISPECIES: hypothetical protein [unclassified Endozoicomonas]|uniref:hypothetical protein n=1 Tax=unclassified Endozoicomonas TaxID=2644528 RepID=UPI00214794D7|nr:MULTISPECIES: hypothetical protein [unclassified Endozoicomonas]